MMDCPALEDSRERVGIKSFMENDQRHGLSSLGLYREYWQEWKEMDTIANRAEAANEMRADFLTRIGSHFDFLTYRYPRN